MPLLIAILSVLLFVVAVFLGRKLSQGIPARVGGGAFRLLVVDALHEFLFQVGIVARGACAVLLEDGAHGAVAFAHRVHMLDGYRQCHGVVEHVCNVDSGISRGDFENFVGVVVVVVAILHGEPVVRVDGKLHLVETTVAHQSDLACDCEIQGIDIAVVLHRKNHVEVGVADIAALHVDEKLPAKLVSEGVCTHRQAFERLHEG